MNNLAEFKNQMQSTANVHWNKNTNLEIFWVFDVKMPSGELWNYISDTSRFNREMGLAARTEEEVEGKLLISTTLIGFPQKWIEEPWTWIEGQTIKSERTYLKGVAKSVQSVFHLVPTGNDMTKVYIYFGWNPSNAFCKWFLSSTESLLKSKFTEVFNKIENYYQSNSKKEKVGAFKKINKEISPEQEARLKELCKKIEESGCDRTILEKFCDYLKSGDEIELDSIKVMKLAYDWGVDYKELLKICLQGSKLGMLNISWNMICPHCRGSRESVNSLGEIPKQASCEPCGVEFGSDAENAVEIVFKLHPSVRTIPNVSYCAAEPAKKSHIKLQQNIGVGEKLTIAVPVVPGSYRYRAKNNDYDIVFKVIESAANQSLDLEAFPNRDAIYELGTKSKLNITNNSGNEVSVSIQQLEFKDFSLRPQHLLFFPEFRELFAEEHLKSDVKLHLGEQTILFTDVVGSTVFYEKVGDAKAFDEVRRHFVDLFAIIKSFEGEIVKTIGDAVMATFPSTIHAFNAAESIQKKFDGNRTDLSLRLRISMHTGVVIAVYLESGMDYFGSAINKCAKIQSLAGAGEVVMTDETFEILKDKIKDYSVQDTLYSPEGRNSINTKLIRIS